MSIIQKQLFQKCPFSYITFLAGPGTRTKTEKANTVRPHFILQSPYASSPEETVILIANLELAAILLPLPIKYSVRNLGLRKHDRAG